MCVAIYVCVMYVQVLYLCFYDFVYVNIVCICLFVCVLPVTYIGESCGLSRHRARGGCSVPAGDP